MHEMIKEIHQVDFNNIQLPDLDCGACGKRKQSPSELHLLRQRRKPGRKDELERWP